MIDLGSPFSQPFQDLITSLEESIRAGVEQPVTDRFLFQSSVTSYPLRYQAEAITRVSGVVQNRFFIFQPEVHFRVSNNRIVWLHTTEKPAEGGRLEVEYTYRERPSGLTDFNPGSVVGTLVRAIARELKLLYEQMDEAYRRAFIDHASGVALDNVVALLGVARNPAIKAQGEVTFFVKSATTRNIPIPVGTRVEDQSRRAYVTTAAGQIEPVITETSRYDAATASIAVTNQVAARRGVPELEGIWPKPPTSEQVSGDPIVAANAPGLALSEDKRTILFAGAAQSARDALLGVTGELLVRYKSASVTLPVEAVEPGPESNVNTGSVVIMPTPPSGVEGVVNEAPISGGLSPESDDQLRDRAKHALERKGNATLDAIKFAVLDVDGVEGVEVADHSSDSAIEVGEVHVRYAGGDDARVLEVVEQTRAAGILARLVRITTVFVSGVFYVIAEAGAPASAASALRDAILQMIDTQPIGGVLSLRRLSALAYTTAGLVEVAEAKLQFRKPNPSDPANDLTGDVTDPFLPAATEQVRADAAQLSVVLLTRLEAVREVGSPTNLVVRVLDGAAQPAAFRSFSLDLSVTLRALLANAPEAPPEIVGRFTRAVSFADATQAVLALALADAPQLRTGGPDAHDLGQPIQVTVAAVAYPSLQAAETTADFSGFA